MEHRQLLKKPALNFVQVHPEMRMRRLQLTFAENWSTQAQTVTIIMMKIMIVVIMIVQAADAEAAADAIASLHLKERTSERPAVHITEEPLMMARSSTPLMIVASRLSLSAVQA